MWAGGRGARPETNDELATRLEAIGGPPVGWELHAGVPLPDGQRAEAVAIPLSAALGWLVALGGTGAPAGVGASVLWLGRVAVEGVRLAARGAIVPTLRIGRRAANGAADASVRWIPALVDNVAIDALAASMPGTVLPVERTSSAGVRRATVLEVMTATVETIVATSVERIDLPAVPPSANSAVDLADTVVARMDGSPFPVRAALASDLSRRLDHWSRPLTDPKRPRLVVQLDAPDSGGVWLLSVFAPSDNGGLTRIDEAVRAERNGRVVTGEWQRLAAPAPRASTRHARPRWPGGAQPGRGVGVHDRRPVPMLAAIGFDVRVPALSRRKATPSLRLFAEAQTGVGGRRPPAEQRHAGRRCSTTSS